MLQDAGVTCDNDVTSNDVWLAYRSGKW